MWLQTRGGRAGCDSRRCRERTRDFFLATRVHDLRADGRGRPSSRTTNPSTRSLARPRSRAANAVAAALDRRPSLAPLSPPSALSPPPSTAGRFVAARPVQAGPRPPLRDKPSRCPAARARRRPGCTPYLGIAGAPEWPGAADSRPPAAKVGEQSRRYIWTPGAHETAPQPRASGTAAADTLARRCGRARSGAPAGSARGLVGWTRRHGREARALTWGASTCRYRRGGGAPAERPTCSAGSSCRRRQSRRSRSAPC